MERNLELENLFYEMKKLSFPFKEDYRLNGTKYPELNEIIKACGDGFLSLNRWNDEKWTTNELDEVYQFATEGNTAEIAVAKLFIELNKGLV